MLIIAVAGNLPDNSKIQMQLDELIGQIKAYISPDNGEPQLGYTVSPPYTGEGWRKWLVRSETPVAGCENRPSDVWDSIVDSRVLIDDPLRDALGETLCERSDLLLAVWNEDVGEMDGATWELLRIALRTHTPCLWISSRSGNVHWPVRTGFEPYRPEKLKEICEVTVDAELKAETCDKKTFPLLGVGRFFYKRYLNRYKASAKAINAKEDLLLREDYELKGRFQSAEPTRRALLSKFRDFDAAAIELGERYHSALYWRSILPLITSLIVAVGFYGTSVLAAVPIFPTTTWSIIAGFGFLFHGLLNLYVFMLSKSRSVRRYQDGMLTNRRVAEMLRVLIHFVPFGIVPDLRKLCGDDKRLYASMRRTIRETSPDAVEISRENGVEAFRHIDEMLSDQIAYHTVSQARYSRLVNHLERWSHIIFYVGFCVIILRAGLQFLMSIPDFPLPDLALGNGLTPRGFISSFANMAALLMPAWFAYFATKLSLCNFRFNRDNHQRMVQLLEEEQKNIERIRQSIDEVPAVAFRAVGEDLAEIMLIEDNSLWTKQYRNTRIEHL